MNSDSIILITVDCLRADHLGCYGYSRPTSPNIDSFAETATIYEHGYANCPGTRWAFQSIHTGVSTLHFQGLGIPEEYTPLAQHFFDEEYRTGGFANNGFVSRDYHYDTGFDTYYSTVDATVEYGILKQFGKFLDDTLNNEYIREHMLIPIHDWLRKPGARENNKYRPAHSDKDTVDQALSFIDNSDDKPYFLWIHLMDAHTPYGYWPDYLKTIRGDTEIEHTVHPGREGKITFGEQPPDEVIDTYDAAIRSADEQIGRLLEYVEDDATIVITGDHGEEFGRYNEFHAASLYSSMTQVPIIVQCSELESTRCTTPAQHLDIPPTLLYSAEIDPPKHWEGEALQTMERSVNDPIFFTLGPDRIAVRVGGWKYIQRNGEGELYRIPHSGSESEPIQKTDQINMMEQLIDKYRSTTGTLYAGQAKISDTELSEEVEDQLEELGYLQD